MPFVGRDMFMQKFILQVEENYNFLKNKKESASLKIPVVTGPSGIGKTTFGRKFAHFLKTSNTLSHLEIVPIYISLHSSGTYCLTDVDRELEPEYLLSFRVLWTWFFSSMSWHEFVDCLLHKYKGFV